MTPPGSLYARPEIVRGEQCAEAPLPPAERPRSCLVVQPAVSRAGRWPHRRAVMCAKRRGRPQVHGLLSQRCRGASMSRCRPCVGRPSRVRCPRVRCPRVWCPRVWCPRVWCPMSGVQCSMSSARVRVRTGVRCPVRASGICVPVVRTSEFVERGRGGSHTSRDRPGRGNLPDPWKPVSRLISWLKCLRFVTKSAALYRTVFATSYEPLVTPLPVVTPSLVSSSGPPDN
jgi:hypothetical protein